MRSQGREEQRHSPRCSGRLGQVCGLPRGCLSSSLRSLESHQVLLVGLGLHSRCVEDARGAECGGEAGRTEASRLAGGYRDDEDLELVGRFCPRPHPSVTIRIHDESRPPPEKRRSPRFGLHVPATDVDHLTVTTEFSELRHLPLGKGDRICLQGRQIDYPKQPSSAIRNNDTILMSRPIGACFSPSGKRNDSKPFLGLPGHGCFPQQIVFIWTPACRLPQLKAPTRETDRVYPKDHLVVVHRTHEPHAFYHPNGREPCRPTEFSIGVEGRQIQTVVDHQVTPIECHMSLEDIGQPCDGEGRVELARAHPCAPEGFARHEFSR